MYWLAAQHQSRTCTDQKSFSTYSIFSVEKNELTPSFNPLNANFTKWSNTLKQFIAKLPTNYLSVFEHFVGLTFKGLKIQTKLLEKLQKPNNAWKTYKYVFRGLRVKALLINPQNYPKQSFVVFAWSMVTVHLKTM